MTKDIEQVVQELEDNFCQAYEDNDRKTHYATNFKAIAKWHLRQVRVAEIRGRIAEANYLYQFDRARVLEKELAEAEKEPKA